MRARRTTVLAAVAFGACVLLPLGAVLLVLGRTGDRGALSVAGIVGLVLGLVCLRILTWVRRARLMTRAGLALHEGPPDP